MANGQGGMLSQAAQNAAAVPAPQPGPVGGAAPTPGAAPPPPGAGAGGPPQVNASGGAGPPPGTVQPGDTLDARMLMPTEGAAYQGEQVDIGAEEATPREQAEYERVVKAMEKILYEEDNLVDAVMQQLDPNNKVSSTSKATTLFIQQVDERLNMDEIVIPQVTQDAVEMITELAEQRFGTQFSEQELQATLGSTWEGVMAMFGVEPDDHAQLVAGMGEQSMAPLRQSYEGFIGQGQPNPSPMAQPGPAAGGAPPTPAGSAVPPGPAAPMPGGGTGG